MGSVPPDANPSHFVSNKPFLHKHTPPPKSRRRLRRRLRLVLLQDLPGDDEPLDLAGALVDLGDARVAVVALSRHVGDVTHPPQDLDGLVSNGPFKDAPARRDARRSEVLTWCEQKVAASDAASLAMAASCGRRTERRSHAAAPGSGLKLKPEARLYLGEGPLGVPKKSRLPGEQAGALQGHAHVGQLKLSRAETEDLKKKQIQKVL